MNKKIKLNDEHYFDFSDGVDLEEEEINEMINDVIDDLKDNDSCFSYSATGNTFILGTKDRDMSEIEINVCKNYKQATLMIDKDKIIPLVQNIGAVNKGKTTLYDLPKSELVDIIYDLQKEINDSNKYNYNNRREY